MRPWKKNTGEREGAQREGGKKLNIVTKSIKVIRDNAEKNDL